MKKLLIVSVIIIMIILSGFMTFFYLNKSSGILEEIDVSGIKPIGRTNFKYLTAIEWPVFPEPTDIFILTPEFGEWYELYSKNNHSWNDGEIPELVSRTHATSILSFGGTVTGSGEGYIDSHILNQKMCDELNLKVMAWLGTICIDPNPEEVGYEGLKEKLLGTSCIDIEGNKIISIVPADESDPYVKNLNHPLWREFLLDITKRTIDLGIISIGIDEISDSVSVITQLDGCFDEYTMSAFRDYLKNKYTKKELTNKGISNIDLFDYGDFIRENHLQKYYSHRFDIPFFMDFIDFQVKHTQIFWEEFTNEIREYGKTKGKDITIAGNTAKFYPVMTAMHSPLDYFSAEIEIGYPSKFKTIPFYKFAISLGKPLFSHPHSTGKLTAEILSRDDLINIWKIYTAEAYSSQGQIALPERYDFWWEEDGGQVLFTSKELDEIGRYYGFIRENPQYYGEIASTARIGLLYSYSSHWSDFDRYSESFYGIQNILLDSQLQYDILFAGDDNWLDDDLSIELLNKYDVIILADTQVLLNRHDTILVSYLENGGRILALGEIGNRDELGKRTKTKMNNLITPGFKKYGQGGIAYFRDNPARDYNSQSRSKEAKQQVKELLYHLIRPNIIVSGENNNLGITEYWNKEDNLLIIHIINYDYDISNKKINSLSNVNFKVSLVDEFKAQELEIFYDSPDALSKEKLDYEINDEWINFNISEIEYYGVISISIQ